MADEKTTATSDTVKPLAEALGKFNQQQVEMISRGIEASLQVFEPLSKASIALTTNVLEAFTRVMENLASSVAPKQEEKGGSAKN